MLLACVVGVRVGVGMNDKIGLTWKCEQNRTIEECNETRWKRNTNGLKWQILFLHWKPHQRCPSSKLYCRTKMHERARASALTHKIYCQNETKRNIPCQTRETNTHIKCKHCAWKWEEKACKIVHCVCAPELIANRWYCTFVLLNNNINSKKKKTKECFIELYKGDVDQPPVLWMHLQCNFIA